MSARPALLDTSVLIARETGRRVDLAKVPDLAAISVVTIAELTAGVLAAKDTRTRAARLSTLDALAPLDPLPITADVARQWAMLRVRLAEEGRSAKVNDLWIAAVAMANGMQVVSQDADFDAIEAVGGPTVIRV